MHVMQPLVRHFGQALGLPDVPSSVPSQKGVMGRATNAKRWGLRAYNPEAQATLMTHRERRIRPSSLTTASDCPRRWAAHHLTEELLSSGYTMQPSRPTHVGAAVGSGVHAGVEYTLAAKRSTGDLGNESEAEDRAVQELRARAEYGLDCDETSPNLSTAQQQVARMTRAYRTYLAPAIEPLIIEERYEADLGDGWLLSGQPDTMTGNPDNLLRDLKTGTQRRVNAVQYGAYAMLLRAAGHTPDGITEDFLRRTKLKVEQPGPVVTVIDLATAAQDALDVIEDIQRATRKFSNRISDPNGRHPPSAFRANPSSPLCSARWCRAWGTDFCNAAKMKGEL